MVTDAPSSRDVLDAFRVPTKGKWYTVGYGESRVTLYSQQVRALNLAWALAEAGQAVPKTRVVVIGGGAAGLSVAAGLAYAEADVTVLEKERDLLPLQRNCHKRHLHPHVFDWPEATADNTRADLPLLDWGAGVARDVALEIEDGFEELCSRHASLRAHCGVENIQLDCPVEGKVTCRLTAENRIETLPYEVLIFALGFGIENPFLTGRRGSYWADDSLDQHGVMPSGEYLVSGSGDGALIDVFRLLLPELTQPGLVRLLRAGISNEDKFTEWIKDVEREVMQIGSLGKGRGIHEQGDFLFTKYATFEPELSVQGICTRPFAAISTPEPE